MPQFDSPTDHSGRPRVLLLDLNNFARFPTLPVGLLTAALRRNGNAVEVLSPLAVGAKGIPRQGRASPWNYWDKRCRWWSATTPSKTLRRARSAVDRLRGHQRSSRGKRLMQAVASGLDRRPDVLLLSAYLMYHDSIGQICALAKERGIPVLMGGPAFHREDTRAAWLGLPGLTGIYAGEAEGSISELIDAVLCHANGSGPSPGIPGLSLAGAGDAGLASPLHDLDALPFPDYDDFPWERYPNRIISMLTARGCGWGVCRFCSDVITVSGRTYRTRSPESVLAELEHSLERYRTSLFCFSDLKLNSDLGVWRGLQENFQSVVPDGKWTCAVHVGPRADEGLSASDLKNARRAGLVRITTGFETGSQPLLDAMKKGTTPERVTDFLAAATEAGISTRITAFAGYPGEEPTDIEATIAFLERADPYLDRVHLSRLNVPNGTPLERDLTSGALSSPSITLLESDVLQAQTPHVNSKARDRSTRKALTKLLWTVHKINRRPLQDSAGEFEGAM